MMKITALIVLAAGTLLGFSGAAAPATTTNLRYGGFTMLGTSVVGYVNMTQDICDIKNAVLAKKPAEALDIYLNGKNSFSGSNTRKFSSWANATHTGANETFYDHWLQAVGGDTKYLDKQIKTAFQEGNAFKAFQLIFAAVQIKYSFHEIDAAYIKTSNNLTDLNSGASHNLDEAWAILAGAHPEQCDTILSLADNVAESLGLSWFGKSPVHLAILAAMNEMQYASIIGTKALEKYDQARKSLRVQMTVLLAQAIHREAYAAALYQNCKSSTWASYAKQAMQAYVIAVAPELKHWGAKPASIAAVSNAAGAEQVKYKAVANALSALMQELNIDPATLGRPVFSKINMDAKCKASQAPAA